MCGICGMVNWTGETVPQKRIEEMSRALIHRGPDEEGFYFSPNGESPCKIGLGFRRLSIIDLATGHQPMQFQNWVIVFNGEIYNYRELKKECESQGHHFLTASDTEVLLHLYAIYGEQCLSKLRGMFAFAIWDEKKKDLFCARDPLGIKPFYYFLNSKHFAFSSETKSLYKSGLIPLEFDPIALLDFFRYRFVPAPNTVLKELKKLPPAHFLKVSKGKICIERYWNIQNQKFEPRPQAELEQELLSQIKENVTMQMVSDVPLGAFLSGGVDSSFITALMAKQSSQKIKTFSIGFEKGTGVDESSYARKVAHFLGTDHHTYYLTEKDLDSAPNILSSLSEPVGDPTILPTALLSKFARQEVKVVLTGEGADELFAGYNRYKPLLYCEWIQRLPKPLQGLASQIARKMGKGKLFQNIPNLSLERWFPLNQDFKLTWMKNLFNLEQENFLEKSYIPSHPFFEEMNSQNPLNSILSLERETALADRLLMKVDMASMSQSLEARPPYLDPTLVDTVSKIPTSYKIRHFKGKYILRKIASQFLPPEIAWRKKHGFIVPIATWMRHGSRDSLQNLLDTSRHLNGFFNSKFVFTLKQKIYTKTASEEEMAFSWPLMVLNAWTLSLKKS